MADVVAISDKSQRDMVLLALAELSLSRPGFDYACREIAIALDSEVVFDKFKELNADRVKDTHSSLGGKL